MSCDKFWALICWMVFIWFASVYKDGGKDKKKKDAEEGKIKNFNPSVRCYFVCTESGWIGDGPFILSNKPIDQFRKLFMHIHTAPNLEKFMSRFVT